MTALQQSHYDMSTQSEVAIDEMGRSSGCVARVCELCVVDTEEMKARQLLEKEKESTEQKKALLQLCAS
jgi:hypothetical protein